MPLSGEAKREAAKRFESKRRKACVRLRIALVVMEEYGCLWAYEMACADEGIEDPLLVAKARHRSVA